MREIFTVRNVTSNNGIRRIHMTHDFFKDDFSQPVEILLNTRSDIFKEGDDWEVHMTLVRRAESKSLPIETPT
jgi:hypothetical protein